jgi:hypothetical protein
MRGDDALAFGVGVGNRLVDEAEIHGPAAKPETTVRASRPVESAPYRTSSR